MMIIHVIIYCIIRHIVLYDVNKYPYIISDLKVSNEISIKISIKITFIIDLLYLSGWIQNINLTNGSNNYYSKNSSEFGLYNLYTLESVG